MKEMSKDEKIQLLERFLRAVVGRPDTEIRYYGGHIRLDCDIEDVIRVLSNLRIQSIEAFFYPIVRKSDWKWSKEKWEGDTQVEFFFEPQYWKENEELKKKIKELEGKKK